jgi:methyltransferase family protein
MASADLVDTKYYDAAPPASLGERLVIAARDRIYDDFIRICRPSPHDSILDVGVSDVVNDAANMLERKYPHLERITAVGLGAGAEFRSAFAPVTYLRHEANQALPFADNAFDVAASNAVLEHVGSRAQQEFFLRELIRVARKVFVSVPNRFFPIEHHTAIPLLQFTDMTFGLACRWTNKDDWAQERNLILMSKRRLKELAPAGIAATIDYTGLMLGPFSSNLFLFADRTA